MSGENHKEKPEKCFWTEEDPEYSIWQTSCGKAFNLEAGTPIDNGMRYCCYCGRLLVEIADEDSK